MSILACGWNWVTLHATILSTVVTALATGSIACFTIRLVGATRGQLTQLIESVRLARDEYISSHRPELEIRFVRFQEGVADKPGDPSPTDLKIEFVVMNVGGSSATIVESNTTVKVMKRPLPAKPPYSANRQSMDNDTIEAGFSKSIGKRFTFTESDWGNYSLGQAVDSQHGTQEDIYFFGYILYADAKGGRRGMGFCRVYNPETNRFDVVQDPYYEHRV